MDDDALLLRELHRLETERKLRAIPSEILTTAWVREAQIEAVIDAMLAVWYAGDVGGYASARHVGEWCARIADAIPDFVDATAARRIGVSFEFDRSVFSNVAELRHLAPLLSRCEPFVTVVREFEQRIASTSPRLAIDDMRPSANTSALCVIDALEQVLLRNNCTHWQRHSRTTPPTNRFHVLA